MCSSSLKIDEGIAGHVMKTLTPWNVKDAYTDQHFSRAWDKHSGYTTKTVLAAPIVVDDK